MKCKYCGAEIDPDRWIPSCQKELEERQLCFTCNHWQNQYDEDQKYRGEHGHAIVNGIHYVIGPEDAATCFRGFGGARVRITFNDGEVRETTNLWCQGDINEAHPHWRELMPDNATMKWL